MESMQQMRTIFGKEHHKSWHGWLWQRNRPEIACGAPVATGFAVKRLEGNEVYLVKTALVLGRKMGQNDRRELNSSLNLCKEGY